MTFQIKKRFCITLFFFFLGKCKTQKSYRFCIMWSLTFRNRIYLGSQSFSRSRVKTHSEIKAHKKSKAQKRNQTSAKPKAKEALRRRDGPGKERSLFGRRTWFAKSFVARERTPLLKRGLSKSTITGSLSFTFFESPVSKRRLIPCDTVAPPSPRYGTQVEFVARVRMAPDALLRRCKK